MWTPTRWQMSEKKFQLVEMLMCQHCCKLLSYSEVIEANHRIDGLNNLYHNLKEQRVTHDADRVRAEFDALMEEGHPVSAAVHHMKTKYSLYPVSPPAQDITTESQLTA